MPAKTNKERQRQWKARHKNEDSFKNNKRKENKCYWKKKKETETSAEKNKRCVDAALRKQKSRLAAKARKAVLQSQTVRLIPPSVLGKAFKKVDTALPHSPRKRNAVVRKLLLKYDVSEEAKVTSNKGLPDNVISDCQVFYELEEISRVDPGRKSVLKSKSGKPLTARRHLLFTISEAYQIFKEKYPTSKIGRSKFASLRPMHVKPYRDIPHNVCVCKHHENFESLRKALSQVIDGFETSTDEYIKKNVCEPTNFVCMNMTCNTCLPNLTNSDCDDDHELITFRQWTSVEKRSENVIHEMSVEEALAEFYKQLKPLLLHSFIQRNSQEAFHNARAASSTENVVLQCDFAENYSYVYQNEIQSAHWSNPQVALFTAVFWAGPENIDSYAIACNDISHDRYCVNTFLHELLKNYINTNPNMKSLHVFSDGAASQFKSKYSFSSATSIKEDLNLHNLQWTFFATSHGKGAVDGIGAVVKRHVWAVVRSSATIVRDAQSFTEICKDLKVKVFCVPKQLIEDSKSELDKMWEHVDTLKGTQKLHHFHVESRYVIAYKQYSSQEKPVVVDLRAPNSECSESTDINEETIDLDEAEDSTSQPIVGQWIVVVYDSMWVPGLIEKLEPNGFIKAKFMKIMGPNRFIWPDTDDVDSIQYSTILTAMKEEPELIAHTGRCIYKLSSSEFQRILNLFIQFN